MPNLGGQPQNNDINNYLTSLFKSVTATISSIDVLSIDVGSLRPLDVLFSGGQWNELVFVCTSECFSSEQVEQLAHHSEL